jgi:FAD/FMN-containing dehydrogenase
VASNVHGKNHHTEGAISTYVEALVLLTENGEILNCSSTENKKLFSETLGGMGLTGIILTVKLRLKKIETVYIRQKTLKAKNIDELLGYFEEHKDYTYSVAWIDCMMKGKHAGRSVLMLGEHALRSELDRKKANEPFRTKKTNQLNIPFVLPSFVLSKVAIKAFNFLFYNKQLKREVDSLIHYEPYFYPLDAMRNWNRIYGKKGFIQYQFVIPFEKGKEGLHRILASIRESGCASFLAVLKTFGPAEQNVSPLSFPTAGYTLALDFKMSKRAFELCEKLDEMVLSFGGRVYLTKDARMKKDTFLKSYKINGAHPAKFNSLQSQRLGIT